MAGAFATAHQVAKPLLAQPAPGGAPGARSGHVRDDRTEGGGAWRRSDPRRSEHGVQAGPLHRPRPDMLHAKRAEADEFQGIAVDGSEVVSLAHLRGAAPVRSATGSHAAMHWACDSSAAGQPGGSDH